MSCCYPCSPCVPSCVSSPCAPSCGTPICYPTGGIGSLCSGGGGSGGGVSSSSLGILSGANVSCVSQTPPSEVVIQPAPVCVTIPGPILSATCEPVRVGGYTACGGGGSLGSRSVYRGLLGSRSSGCCSPCV